MSVEVVLMFMEMLVSNGLQPSTVRNYITAVACYSKWMHLPTEVFYHEKVNLMLKAIERSVHRPPLLRPFFKLKILSTL